MSAQPAGALQRPVPLAQSASMLARFCDALDANEAAETPQPITEVTQALFAGLRRDLVVSVDEHIKFFRALKGLIAGAKVAEAYWRARRKNIEEVLDAFETEVKATIEAEPDQPYEGKLGKLKIRNNGGQPKLLTSFTRYDRSLTNIVDPQTAERVIPSEFLETVTVMRLNTDAVRAEIKRRADEGLEPIPWAELERGTHVGGW